MSRHEEFPELTLEALAAATFGLGYPMARVIEVDRRDRIIFAAFLREAMKQATHGSIVYVDQLQAIADNLHSPPPPAPTLAQAREAARQLGGANAEVVHAFLATLAEVKA